MFKLLTTVALLGLASADTHAPPKVNANAAAIKTATSAATAPKIKDHSANYKF